MQKSGIAKFLLVLGTTPCLLAAAERSIYSVEAVEFTWQLVAAENIPANNLQYTEDFNNDGYTDVFLSGWTPIDEEPHGGDSGVILLNNGDNTFTAAGGDQPVSEWAREILIADFNGDQIPDVFIADHGWDTNPFPGFKNQLLFGTGTGFTDETHRLPDIDDFSHNAAEGDIDNDGDVDIFVANTDIQPAEEVSYFLINDGAGNFSLDRSRLPTRLSSPTGTTVTLAAEIADLDGDNAPELIIGQEFDFGGTPALSEIYWNDGAGNYSDALKTVIPEMENFKPADGSQIIEIQAFDIDNDSDQDLLLSANNNDPGFRGIGLQLMINQGGRQFTDRSLACLAGEVQLDSSDRSKVFHFKFADINFDGATDVLMESGYDGTDKSLLAFENTGGLKFRAITHHSLSNEQEVRDRLFSHPLLGNGVFGIGEFFPFEDNGTPVVGINYLPIVSTALPPIANQFDSCTSKLHTNVDAASTGNFELSFTILQTEPTVLIQADATTAVQLSTLPTGAASFNPDTGVLTIPELVVDDQVAYTNLQFTITDGEQLIFQLTGSD